MTEALETSRPGRRERKKRETRHAIKSAALALALEHGADQVTVEQISDAADVAPRTFFNYFSGKEEALLGESDALTAELRELLESHPREENTLPALRSAFLRSEHVGTAEDRRQEMLDRCRLVARNPSLVPHQLARYARLERMLTEVVAQRLGTTTDADLQPALFAAIATTAYRVASERWTTSGQCTLTELVSETFDLLEHAVLAPDAGSDRSTTRPQDPEAAS